MHLSKQQFSKLTKKEKAALAAVDVPKGGNSTRKKGKVKRGKSTPGSVKNHQGGVAAVNYSSPQRVNAPVISASRNSCRIRHKEFIQNVDGQVLFTNTRLIVNPGRREVFPWLSTQAQGWERYKFHSLKFHLHTRASTITTGSIIMAPEYDANAPKAESEQVLCTYEDAMELPPWRDASCQFKFRNMVGVVQSYFIRHTNEGPVSDVKLYDVGTFQIATVDASGDDQLWSKLWVEYDVEFLIPQLPPLGLQAYLSGGSFIGGGAMTGTNPLGNLPNADLSNANIAVDDVSTITFDSAFNDDCDIVVAFICGGTFVAGTTPPTSVESGSVSRITSDTCVTTTYHLSRYLLRKGIGTGAFKVTNLNNGVTAVSGSDVWIAVCPKNSLSLSKNRPTISRMSMTAEEIMLIKAFRSNRGKDVPDIEDLGELLISLNQA